MELSGDDTRLLINDDRPVPLLMAPLPTVAYTFGAETSDTSGATTVVGQVYASYPWLVTVLLGVGTMWGLQYAAQVSIWIDTDLGLLLVFATIIIPVVSRHPIALASW